MVRVFPKPMSSAGNDSKKEGEHENRGRASGPDNLQQHHLHRLESVRIYPESLHRASGSPSSAARPGHASDGGVKAPEWKQK